MGANPSEPSFLRECWEDRTQTQPRAAALLGELSQALERRPAHSLAARFGGDGHKARESSTRPKLDEANIYILFKLRN